MYKKPKVPDMMLNIINRQGNADENHNEIPFVSTRMAIIKNKTSANEDVEKLEPYHGCKNVKVCSLCRKQFGGFSNY